MLVLTQSAQRCGLVMNKDEIQRVQWKAIAALSCGLVMNKDEIQLLRLSGCNLMSCGLVMNKDEIQPPGEYHLTRTVVVWWWMKMIYNGWLSAKAVPAVVVWWWIRMIYNNIAYIPIRYMLWFGDDCNRPCKYLHPSPQVLATAPVNTCGEKTPK